MRTEKHYVVEQLEDGQYTVHTIASNRPAEMESAVDDQPELVTAERKPATAEQSEKTTRSRRAR
jgi:hypothetical protein